MQKYTMFSLRLTNSSFKQQISIGVPKLLYCLGMRQFKFWSAVLLIYSNMYCYPLIVFDVDISSFAKKVAQNLFKTSFFCCQVQGSSLMEKKKVKWLTVYLHISSSMNAQMWTQNLTNWSELIYDGYEMAHNIWIDYLLCTNAEYRTLSLSGA